MIFNYKLVNMQYCVLYVLSPHAYDILIMMFRYKVPAIIMYTRYQFHFPHRFMLIFEQSFYNLFAI